MAHLSLFMVSYHHSSLFTPFFWAVRKRWSLLSYRYLSDVGNPHKVSFPPLNWLKYRYRHLSGITTYMPPPFRILSHRMRLSPSLASIGRIGVDWDLGIWVMWFLFHRLLSFSLLLRRSEGLMDWSQESTKMTYTFSEVSLPFCSREELITGVDQDSDRWPIHSPRFLYQSVLAKNWSQESTKIQIGDLYTLRGFFTNLFSRRIDHRSWLRYKASEWRGYPLIQGFFPPLFASAHFSFPLFWPIGTSNQRIDWGIDIEWHTDPSDSFTVCHFFFLFFCSVASWTDRIGWDMDIWVAYIPSLFSLFISFFCANRKKWPQELTET